MLKGLESDEKIGATIITNDSPLLERRPIAQGRVRAIWVPPSLTKFEQLRLVRAELDLPESGSLGPLLRARGVRRALLVTDASHMRRAMRLLADAGFDVLPAPVRALDAPRQPGERIRLLHETLRESLALLYYGVAGYR